MAPRSKTESAIAKANLLFSMWANGAPKHELFGLGWLFELGEREFREMIAEFHRHGRNMEYRHMLEEVKSLRFAD